MIENSKGDSELAGEGKELLVAYDIRYAGFWRRFAAFIFDLLFIAEFNILLLAAYSVYFLWKFLQPIGADSYNMLLDPEVKLRTLLFVESIFLLNWMYFTALESSRLGGTLGKLVFNLRVTDPHGKQVSFARSNARLLAKLLSCLTLGVGFLVAGLNKQKRSLHDKLCDTIVVYAKNQSRQNK